MNERIVIVLDSKDIPDVVDALNKKAASSAIPSTDLLDSAMLNWMIFKGAQVCHAGDDEFCWVQWSDRDGDYETDNFDQARDAIKAAMEGRI